MEFASMIVEKRGNPCLIFKVNSYLLLYIPVIYISSPGLAVSMLSPKRITSLLLGILPGKT